jgi:hypothetical protein
LPELAGGGKEAELLVFLFHCDESKLSEGPEAFVVVAFENMSGDGLGII